MAAWVRQDAAGARHWASIALSADGTKVVAVDGTGIASSTYTGYIYTSTDGGTTWTARTGAGQLAWRVVASTRDGSHLFAGVYNGGVYYSGDFGATWAATSLPAMDWRGIAISDDAKKVVATAYNGGLYTSTDGGVTWAVKSAAGARYWTSVCTSANGAIIFATERGSNSNGNLYLSKDSGSTWTAIYPADAWTYSAMSPDGTKIWALAASSSYPNYSTDGGTTWKYVTIAAGAWKGVGVSPDGKIVNLNYTDQSGNRLMRRSTDGGSTWTSLVDPSIYFQYAGYSSDGMTVVMSDTGNGPGYLYAIRYSAYPVQTWKNMFLGSTQVQALYMGSRQIWAKP